MIGRLKNDLEIAKAAQAITQHELARVEAKAAEILADKNERDDFERIIMEDHAKMVGEVGVLREQLRCASINLDGAQLIVHELNKEISSAHLATVKAQDELARITQINDNTSEKLEACRDDSNTLRRRFVAAQQELDVSRQQYRDAIAMLP